MAVRLHAFEETDSAGTAAAKAFKALRDAFPDLDFPLRSEPRETLVEAIDERWAAGPSVFRDALTLFLESHAATIPAGALETALSVLADSAVRLREGELVLAQTLLADARWQGSRDDGFRSLILLVHTGNWRAIVALLERILADGAVHARVLQAGLESVARYTPSQLGAVLVRFGDKLERIETGILRHIVGQLVAQATPYVALLALLELDPLRCPRLVAAAFEGESPPFRFESDPTEDEEDKAIAIWDHMQRLPLSDERTGTNVQDWIALATTAIRGMRDWSPGTLIVAVAANASTPSSREASIISWFGRPAEPSKAA